VQFKIDFAIQLAKQRRHSQGIPVLLYDIANSLRIAVALQVAAASEALYPHSKR